MENPIQPEVRLLEKGDQLCLCSCGRSSEMPDCRRQCAERVEVIAPRQMRVLLCLCGQSKRLPYCDGSHSPPAEGLLARWRRFAKGL